jgi:hypothetical protein
LLLSCLLPLALALPASAQNAFPRLGGTISQTRNGQTTKANVFWQAPGSLKIEVLGAKNEVARTIVASGDQTLSFDSAAKRVHVLNANIAREWFRGWNIAFGGPANFAFTGATGFSATADQGVTLVRDRALLGQDSARTFYIAWKQRVRAIPAQVKIENSVRSDYGDATPQVGPGGRKSSLEQNGLLATPLMRATITFDAQKLPQRAEVEASGDKVSFVYALQPRADAFPDGTFALPDAAKDALREEETLRAPSSYADATPDELTNHGASLWNASGDAAGALALWARASAANPRATAPKFWTFDVALATRQPMLAARALESLKGDLSEADAGFLRARLDTLRGDESAVAQDLRVASSTGDAARMLAYSLAQKAGGDLSGARATWTSLLGPSIPRDVQAQAGENLALAATKSELATLGATLSGDAEALRLARALLDLRGGKTMEATFASPELEASLARAFERADDDDAAKRAWESLESSGNEAGQNEARAHLVALAARAGDAGEALGVWSRWNATLRSETGRIGAQNVLFDAFQKAAKIEALRRALLNRATATGAKNLDLQLQLAFQEQFGTDADTKRATDAGLTRFPKEPFWAGKKAEQLVSQGFLVEAIDEVGFRRRNAIFKQATDLLDSAIKNSPEPSFYVQQKALLLIQRGTKNGGIIDAGESARNEEAARAQLALLEASDDPDLATVAAVGWNAFPARKDKARSVALAVRALDSAPVDGDRTTLVFANRQVLARQVDAQGAAVQWRTLLDVARSAGDEASLVAALLGRLESRKDSAGMAQLLVRVAGERWSLDAHSGLLNGAASRIAASPLMPDVIKALDSFNLGTATDAETNKGFLIARAALAAARLARANAVISQPGAPPEADAELERATRAQSAALTALQPMSDSDEPFWSSRARLLLLEGPSLSPDAKRALLEKLAAREPDEPSVVLALASAQRDPKARAQTARTLEFSPETWRRLALDALAGGDRDGATFWSQEAFAFAAHSPTTSANDFQRIAFARAKIAYQSGATSVATTIYSGLAGAGWANIDRASALLALRRRLQEAGRTPEADALTPQIQALGLGQDEGRTALAFLNEVEN